MDVPVLVDAVVPVAVAVVEVVAVDFLVVFSVEESHHQIHTVAQRIHNQIQHHHIPNKHIILAQEPTPTTDGIPEEINIIQIQDITTIPHRLLQTGQIHHTKVHLIVSHKMRLDHFVQLAVVIFFTLTLC